MESIRLVSVSVSCSCSVSVRFGPFRFVSFRFVVGLFRFVSVCFVDQFVPVFGITLLRFVSVSYGLRNCNVWLAVSVVWLNLVSRVAKVKTIVWLLNKFDAAILAWPSFHVGFNSGFNSGTTLT